MKVLEVVARLIFVGIVLAVVGGAYLLYRLVERTVQTIDREIGPLFYLIAASAALFAFVILVIGGAVVALRWLHRRSRQIHARDSLYPVQDLGRGRYINLNEPGAQSIAAAAQARRPTAALAGRIIDAHYRNAIDAMPEQLAALPAPEPAPLTVASLAAVDLRTDPHWLLIGATGSGKTVASYAILAELSRRAPCEFVICELGGVNWPQATATTTPEIVAAILSVQAEMERRQGLLRTYGVDHVQDLAGAPPYLFLLVEEIDATLDDLRIVGSRDQRAAAVVALRAIARMGRKSGVCLFAVSTSGTTDVFDPHVRKNMSSVLLFRSEHTVSETWRLPGVRLTDLEPGMAYSLRHGAMIRFPYARRPRLPLASLPIDALPAPESTGIPVQWPVYHPEPALGSGIPVFSTDDRSAYTTEQIAHIRARRAALGSIKAVERELYGQEGGYWFYRLKEVIT